MEGSSARSRGLPGFTGLNSGYQSQVSESLGANLRSSSQAINATGGSNSFFTPSITTDSAFRSSMWRQQSGQTSGGTGLSNATPGVSTTVMSRHSYHAEPGSSNQTVNSDQLPASSVHCLQHESSQSFHCGQQRVPLTSHHPNNLPSDPPNAGQLNHQRAPPSSSHFRMQEASSSPASISHFQQQGQQREAQLAPLQLSRARTQPTGLNERLRLIYHTWSAAALSAGDQHDLESPFTSTSLNPLTAG